jgi:hypothetical protein
VFKVIIESKGSNEASIRDFLITNPTHVAKLLFVIFLAIKLVVVIVKFLILEISTTGCAIEMVLMEAEIANPKVLLLADRLLAPKADRRRFGTIDLVR